MEFLDTKPFPYMVTNEILPTDNAENLREDIFSIWTGHPGFFAKKDEKTTKNKWYIPQGKNKYWHTKSGAWMDTLNYLNSAPFLIRLSGLTGIPNLLPDPYLNGAGPHIITRGGYLDVHVDFNRLFGLRRRLNLLIYLCPDWKSEWGGNLELYTGWGELHDIIEPGMNKAVIFETSEKSFHGHPKPLRCPEDQQRISWAMYYYTQDDKPGQPTHSTIYKDWGKK